MHVATMESDRRVALFVDGDNLPASLSGALLSTAGRLGRADVRRVYAAEAGLRGWSGVPGFRPVLAGGAKNGSDLLLCIEAVEVACGGRFATFAVASDDRDFSHLAHWLRERGCHVLGLGTERSPAGWRAACSEFEVIGQALERVRAGSASEVGETAAVSVRAQGSKAILSEEAVHRSIRNLIASGGGRIELGALGARMGALHRTTLATLGVSSWRTFLAARQDLYALDPKGPEAKVRWIGP